MYFGPQKLCDLYDAHIQPTHMRIVYFRFPQTGTQQISVSSLWERAMT